MISMAGAGTARRFAIRWIGLAGLLALPLVITAQLLLTYRAVAASYIDLIALTRRPGVGTVLSELSTTLEGSPHRGAPATIKDIAPPLGIVYAPALRSLVERDLCLPLAEYHGQPASMGCASFVAPDATPADVAGIAERVASAGVAAALRSAYGRLAALMPISSATDGAPSLTFVYALVDDPIAGPVAIFYPGASFDRSYPLQSRPWFLLPLQASELAISGTYRDYVTNSLVVSIATPIMGSGQLQERVVADLRVVLPSVSFGIFSINAGVAFAASLFLWALFRVSEQRTAKLLAMFATALFVTYLILTVSEFAREIGYPAPTTRALVVSILPFVPSPLFAILGARQLRLLSTSWQQIALLYALQSALAGLGAHFDSRAPVACFSSAALLYLGSGLWYVRQSFNDVASELPSPGSAARLAAYSCGVWAAAQMLVAVVPFDAGPVRAAQEWMSGFTPSVDLLFTETTGFVILLYSKGIALSAICLFGAGSEAAHRIRRVNHVPGVPWVQTDLNGIVRPSKNLRGLLQLPEGTSLLALIPDALDRLELSDAIRLARPLNRYLTKVPELFGDHTVALAVDRPPGASVATVYFTYPLEVPLAARIESALASRLSELFDSLDQLSNLTGATGDAPTAAATGAIQAVRSESRELLRALSSRAPLTMTKSSFDAVWAGFAATVSRSLSPGGCTIVQSSSFATNMPAVVRIHQGLVGAIASGLCGAVRRTAGHSAATIVLGASVHSDENPGYYGDVLRLTVTLCGFESCRSQFALLRATRLEGRETGPSDEYSAVGRLREASEFAEFFGGRIGCETTPEGDCELLYVELPFIHASTQS